MQITVSGKNMDSGSAFQDHANTQLDAVVSKYFPRAVSGKVTLEKDDKTAFLNYMENGQLINVKVDEENKVIESVIVLNE